MSLPDYLNCQNEELVVCDFYIHNNCPNTCAYARDIMGIKEINDDNFREEDLGIGAIVNLPELKNE